MSKGMLSSAETVDIIADCLAKYGVPSVVLDPVCSLTYGLSWSYSECACR